MKITIHKMKNCELCNKCKKLLKHWGIPHRTTYDNPTQNRPYPYLTIELEYEECIEWITEDRLNENTRQHKKRTP